MTNKYSIYLYTILIFAVIYATAYFFFVNKHNYKHATLTNSMIEDYYHYTPEFYYDTDHDGNSEIITYSFLQANNQTVVSLTDKKSNNEKLWYLNGSPAFSNTLICDDYNNDSITELYFFTKDNNKLFLHFINTQKSNSFIINSKIIMNEFYSRSKIKLNDVTLNDIVNTPEKEVLIVLSSEPASSRNKIICYDIKNNELTMSDEECKYAFDISAITDIDNDSKPELLLSTLNNKNEVLKNNTLLLNNVLKPISESNIFIINSQAGSLIPFINDTSLILAKTTWSFFSNESADISFVDQNGEEIKKIKSAGRNFVFVHNRKTNSDFLTFEQNGKIFSYNNKLREKEWMNVNRLINQVHYIDIDKNGIQEILLISNNVVLIIDTHKKKRSYIDIPGIGDKKINLSLKESVDKPNTLSVISGNNQHFITFDKKNTSAINIITAISSAILTLLIFLTLKFVRHIKKSENSYEEEVLQLQIELMKNQLDPHFVFNALNSISFSINTGDKKNAYNNLGVFSKLMRQSIVELEEFYRNLEDEINFVKHYLHLEKFRFKEQFNYHLIISPQVNLSAVVPKMCLFCYVEGALKKGVLTNRTGGNIEIKIDKNENEDLLLSINDDGIHRNVEKYKSSLSNSMLAMKHIIDYYNKDNKNKITVDFTDNGTADEPKGSNILITIPFGFRF